MKVVVPTKPIYFGNNLYVLRTHSRMTKNQVAEKLGIARACIRYWEDKGTMPNVLYAGELATLFGVTLDELVYKDLSNDGRFRDSSNA